MNLKKIKLIFFIQIIYLLNHIRSDHVQVIRCAKQPKCLENLNWNLLKVIKENLSNYSEPCENFWNYACGSWTAAPYYDHVDNFGAMANYYADHLIRTLRELHLKIVFEEYQEIKELIEQIMIYFRSCVSSGNYYLNMAGYLKEIPFKNIWDPEFEWPKLFKDLENEWHNFDWLKMLALLRKYGFKELFLKETVGFSAKNSSQYVLHLAIPQVSIKFENKYRVLQILKEFNLIFPNIAQNYKQIAYDVYELEKELQYISKKYQQIKQTYFLTLHDLQYLVPHLNWSLYFELLLNRQLPAKTPVEFSGNWNYFSDFNILISQKPKRVISLYILIRFFQYLLDIRPIITNRECLLHTNVMFPYGINFIYDQFLYKNRLEDELILQNMFLLLKGEFSLILNENKFSLKSTEIQFLQNKLKKMELRIGNLPFHLQNINLYYHSAQLKPNNFYQNHLEMLKFRTIQQHSQVLKAFDYKTYYINDDISQLRSAPYYIHQRNLLLIPMLFLQLPFYHYSQHPVYQYSLVGWIMAHELSHAFDAHGLQFDADGNKNFTGLQLSRNPLYLSAVECVTKYDTTVSLNERMADVNGLQLAWQTFRHHVLASTELNRHHFLNQLFFINFAQFFCGSLPQAIDHDRDDVRVKQAVVNMQEFAEVFYCPKENPVLEKCNIWKK